MKRLTLTEMFKFHLGEWYDWLPHVFNQQTTLASQAMVPD